MREQWYSQTCAKQPWDNRLLLSTATLSSGQQMKMHNMKKLHIRTQKWLPVSPRTSEYKRKEIQNRPQRWLPGSPSTSDINVIMRYLLDTWHITDIVEEEYSSCQKDMWHSLRNAPNLTIQDIRTTLLTDMTLPNLKSKIHKCPNQSHTLLNTEENII